MRTWLTRGYDADYIMEQALLWHTSAFSNKGINVPKQYMSAVGKWLKKLGYRFAIRNSNIPGTASFGDSLQICLWLENCGIAPIYRNYPFTLRLKGEHETVDHATGDNIRANPVGDRRQLPSAEDLDRCRVAERRVQEPDIMPRHVPMRIRGIRCSTNRAVSSTRASIT
jgi:hypothetical protein